jgi:hypothetical protein
MIPFTHTDLFLSPNAPRKPYELRPGKEKLSVHWGQRKLLLTEMAFLTRECCRGPAPTIVYAGAAPGIHIPTLSTLFPEVTFHLYDPVSFGFSETPKLHLYQRKFTSEDAENWSKQKEEEKERNILFISDIRTADHRVMTPQENEETIIQDLQLQETWYHQIRPVSALLKFRLPYPSTSRNPTFTYLDGLMMKQVWSPQTTTETRLIPNGQRREYDLVTYEQQLFYHNTEVREKVLYQNPWTLTTDPIDPPELLNDYDSVAEASILREYLQSRGSSGDLRSVIDLSRQLTRGMSQQGVNLNSLRHSDIKSTTKRVENRRHLRGCRDPN